MSAYVGIKTGSNMDSATVQHKLHLHNVYTQEGQIKTRPSFAESYECQQVHIPQRTCSELQVWEQ